MAKTILIPRIGPLPQVVYDDAPIDPVDEGAFRNGIGILVAMHVLLLLLFSRIC